MERECVKIPTIYEVTECDKKISCFLRNVMPPIGVDGKKITERDLRWIRMTRDSYSFITFYKDSKKILDHIKENYLGDISMKTLIATDLTAHIGGDVLAFASEFKFVEAVEIDDEAYDFLKNNINVYGFENVSAHFEDSVRWIAGLEDVGDIVFMDPPWGGSGYRKNRYMKLSLSGTGVEDIAIELMQKPKPPMLVVLKLPMNYDMKFLKKKLSDFSVESVTVGKLLVVFISAK